MPREKIEPALTAEEWHRARQEAFDLGATPLRDFAQGVAVANAGLPDSDPRKITRDTISLLRLASEELAAYDRRNQTDEGKQMSELADALESYLPPAFPK